MRSMFSFALQDCKGSKGTGQLQLQQYKRVAIVEHFYNIIHTVHVETDAKNGKHAGQKKTYRAITEKYAFLPREAVTRFLLQCKYCQKRGNGSPIFMDDHTKESHARVPLPTPMPEDQAIDHSKGAVGVTVGVSVVMTSRTPTSIRRRKQMRKSAVGRTTAAAIAQKPFDLDLKYCLPFTTTYLRQRKRLLQQQHLDKVNSMVVAEDEEAAAVEVEQVKVRLQEEEELPAFVTVICTPHDDKDNDSVDVGMSNRKRVKGKCEANESEAQCEGHINKRSCVSDTASVSLGAGDLRKSKTTRTRSLTGNGSSKGRRNRNGGGSTSSNSSGGDDDDGGTTEDDDDDDESRDAKYTRPMNMRREPPAPAAITIGPQISPPDWLYQLPPALAAVKRESSSRGSGGSRNSSPGGNITSTNVLKGSGSTRKCTASPQSNAKSGPRVKDVKESPPSLSSIPVTLLPHSAAVAGGEYSNGVKDEDDEEDGGCGDGDEEPFDKIDSHSQAASGYDPERLKAFNLFVRMFVDENLDRFLPISKQPKEKIQAIVDSCGRQFPEYSERARNRIRAYLKTCRRNKKVKEATGDASGGGMLDLNKPTPAHLTSPQAEQILAQACENESQNATRMRMGLEPISQPFPAQVTSSVHALPLIGVGDDDNGLRFGAVTSPSPPVVPEKPKKRANNRSVAAQAHSDGSYSVFGDPSGGGATGLRGYSNGDSSPSPFLAHATTTAAMAAVALATQSSHVFDFSRRSNGVSSLNKSNVVAASPGQQQRQQASTYRNGSGYDLNLLTGLPNSSNGEAGPTDLSMKSTTATADDGDTANHQQLNMAELTKVRQLILGYRESAAFLLRSADELEQLLLQQQ